MPYLEIKTTSFSPKLAVKANSIYHSTFPHLRENLKSTILLPVKWLKVWWAFWVSCISTSTKTETATGRKSHLLKNGKVDSVVC